jgi:nicotinate-nucleotide pyrophosphorylase
MNICTMSIKALASDADLCLEVKLNNETKFKKALTTDLELIKFDFDDARDSNHILEIIMSGKQPEHTVLDNTGSIIKDRLIEIVNVSLDEIELGQLFLDQAIYLHDFNGTSEKTQDQFFGKMGCNGVLRLEFTSPVYLWLLENM